MRIRLETEADFTAVEQITRSAFDEDAESKLIARLRKIANPVISLVAESGGSVIGHILFSPITLDANPSLQMMGLAPMAVKPDRQREGVGSALVRAGLENCRKINMGAVVVLGHPDYYPKFGFRPAVDFGIKSEYEVPDEAFMLLELQDDYLKEQSGIVKYHEEFSRL